MPLPVNRQANIEGENYSFFLHTVHIRHTFKTILIYFQDLYSVLLEAESAGIMDDVDLTKVEKLILDPKADDTSRRPLGNTAAPKVKKKSILSPTVIDGIELD